MSVFRGCQKLREERERVYMSLIDTKDDYVKDKLKTKTILNSVRTTLFTLSPRIRKKTKQRH